MELLQLRLGVRRTRGEGEGEGEDYGEDYGESEGEDYGEGEGEGEDEDYGEGEGEGAGSWSFACSLAMVAPLSSAASAAAMPLVDKAYRDEPRARVLVPAKREVGRPAAANLREGVHLLDEPV